MYSVCFTKHEPDVFILKTACYAQLWVIYRQPQGPPTFMSGSRQVEKLLNARREDSLTLLLAGVFEKLEVGKLCKTEFYRHHHPLVITPGINVIRLNKRANQVGKYYLGQVAIHIKISTWSPRPRAPGCRWRLRRKAPTLKLYKRAAPLLSGIEQIMNLILTVGSYTIEPSPGFALCLKNAYKQSNTNMEVLPETDLKLALIRFITRVRKVCYNAERRYTTMIIKV
ncbi:hypothetical protein NQ318_000940 [Aromia moschata]|uniref:Uncharacterized protein n=1 Tax=Aromia moschata TaxID=1265417 RepID=A0AAV8ZFQ8_9CUCU|nr:hypothetical protein NQ318_000940 [Aromia moschata]